MCLSQPTGSVFFFTLFYYQFSVRALIALPVVMETFLTLDLFVAFKSQQLLPTYFLPLSFYITGHPSLFCNLMVFLFLFNVFFHFGPFAVDILQIFIYIPLFFLLCTFSLSNSIIFELSISHLDGIILKPVNFQSWMRFYPHLFRYAYICGMPS